MEKYGALKKRADAFTKSITSEDPDIDMDIYDALYGIIDDGEKIEEYMKKTISDIEDSINKIIEMKEKMIHTVNRFARSVKKIKEILPDARFSGQTYYPTPKNIHVSSKDCILKDYDDVAIDAVLDWDNCEEHITVYLVKKIDGYCAHSELYGIGYSESWEDAIELYDNYESIIPEGTINRVNELIEEYKRFRIKFHHAVKRKKSLGVYFVEYNTDEKYHIAQMKKYGIKLEN